MKVYKLTSENGLSWGGFRYTQNEWIESSGNGDLCSDGWLHFYRDPRLAILHNPIFSNYKNPTLWEAEADGNFLHHGYMKSGCTRLRLKRVIEVPDITPTQAACYGIIASLATSEDNHWLDWASDYLKGADRSDISAMKLSRQMLRIKEGNLNYGLIYSLTGAVFKEFLLGKRCIAQSASYASSLNTELDLITVVDTAMLY